MMFRYPFRCYLVSHSSASGNQSKLCHMQLITNHIQAKRSGIGSTLGFCFLMALFLSSCKKVKPEPTGIGSCKAVTASGDLTRDAQGKYKFRTNSGGTIEIDLTYTIKISHDDYPGLNIELWGEYLTNGQSDMTFSHENLNGKHIKDRLGSRRTFIFPDGAKITMVASAEVGPLLSVGIYDGGESHHINASCNQLEYSSMDLAQSQQLDNNEADGETSTFEITPTGLILWTIYEEATPGNKIMNQYKLGELKLANPNQVLDFYDDPRLNHT